MEILAILIVLLVVFGPMVLFGLLGAAYWREEKDKEIFRQKYL